MSAAESPLASGAIGARTSQLAAGSAFFLFAAKEPSHVGRVLTIAVASHETDSAVPCKIY